MGSIRRSSVKQTHRQSGERACSPLLLTQGQNQSSEWAVVHSTHSRLSLTPPKSTHVAVQHQFEGQGTAKFSLDMAPELSSSPTRKQDTSDHHSD